MGGSNGVEILPKISVAYNLSQSQIKKRLQGIQSNASVVTRTPKSSHITPVLKSLHWL